MYKRVLHPTIIDLPMSMTMITLRKIFLDFDMRSYLRLCDAVILSL